MERKRKNIFVLGLNEGNRKQLANIPQSDEEYIFHSLLTPGELVEAETYDFARLLHKARKQLQEFGGPIDGIITFWDFPATELRAVLCEEINLPSPPVHTLINCAHKYCSRMEQQKVIPENIPLFQAVNPFEENPLSKINLDYPFFLKPVKSYSGFLSFFIGGREDFKKAIEKIRSNISRYALPYNSFLQSTGVNTNGVDANWCIAEELIGGKMCTIEGYVYRGEVSTFGLIDSHRYPGKTSFSRYQYPSTMPVSVRRRIDEVTKKVMRQLRYNSGAFNIEYFYNQRLDKIWLLEVNPRISQSHSDLFYKVDGAPNQKVIVELACGKKPIFPRGEGRYKVAAKFYIRKFQDGILIRFPDQETICKLENEIPGTILQLYIRPGQRLSELQDQDSYSYRLAAVYMGAQSQKKLLANFRRCKETLNLRVRKIEQ